MSTNDMRGHIIAAYPGEEWKRKVQKMSEPQLLAIYKRLQKHFVKKGGITLKGTNVFAKVINFISGQFRRKSANLQKSSKPEVHDTLGGKGHYYDGNASAGYYHRSSQRKRRKMERRRGQHVKR